MNESNIQPEHIDVDVPMTSGAKSPSRIQNAINQALRSTVAELLQRQNLLEQRIAMLESILHSRNFIRPFNLP